MNNSKNLTKDKIKEIYKKNYSKIEDEFLNIQSLFLSDIYKRYLQDLDSANIVLCYAKNLHNSILKQREEDLEYCISFDSFWKNHSEIKQKNFKISDICFLTGLPKETARRKVQLLLKNNVLKKNGKKTFWEPTIKEKNTYNQLIDGHIIKIIRLINLMSNFIGLNIPKEKIIYEIKKNFSFYWFHYLKVQLEYLKIWQEKTKDLELLLIIIECLILANREYAKKDISYELHFFNKKSSDNETPDVSATSISDITSIPRATCIRKLEKLVKHKIIKKNKATKKYFFDIFSSHKNYINTKEISSEIMNIYSDFYLIFLRSLMR